ncbi:MAG: PAS domain-containing protein [Deltaproteobacteria bacterium]|nr:PAS domain-containing protein [Deltaproteobacteria bacterium]
MNFISLLFLLILLFLVYRLRADYLGKLQVLEQANTLNIKKNITDLKLLESETLRLRAVLEGMQEGVMLIDENRRIRLVNTSLLKIFNLQESPLGKTPLEVFRNIALEKMLEKIFSDCEFCEQEIVLEGPVPSYLQVHSGRVKNTQGAVIVFHDVTHLRKLEQVRREFVANASHELKTPLAAIKGYTETLLAGAYRDETHALKFLKIIETHANRLHAIINDLLDLSKMESAQYQLKIEKIEVAALFEELRATFAQACEQKNIRFEISPFQQQQVWADLPALRQILSNLLENAIKYSPTAARISLSLETQGEKVVFQVKDTGPGIAPEHLSRLFERFYRVDPSRSREQGGTGLGLPIVKHLVQHHGGRVWVESHFGEGACFYVELPQRGMI